MENLSRRDLLKRFGFLPVGRRLVAFIDADDVVWAREITWLPQRRFDDKIYARENTGERRMLHLMVAQRHHGPRPSPEHVCEHLNGDLLDCRASNLQWALKGETIARKRVDAQRAARRLNAARAQRGLE